MDKSKVCLICMNQGITDRSHDSGVVHNTCLYCGTYRILQTCIELLHYENFGRNIAKHQPSDKQRQIISGYIRYTGNVLIDELSLPSLMALKAPSLSEKADRLISMVFRKSDSFGSEVSLFLEGFETALICGERELFELVKYLESSMLVEHCGSSDKYACKLTYDGWIHAEEAEKQTKSNNIFIAMWFNPDFRKETEPAIRAAISASGMDPLTVDQDEHVEKVDDKIIVDINRSRAIVADFTNHRGGVYFEAGYAMGRGLPVIWMCRSDYAEDLHFDIRQYNCIEWDSPNELEEKLEARLGSLFG